MVLRCRKCKKDNVLSPAPDKPKHVLEWNTLAIPCECRFCGHDYLDVIG